MKDSVGEPGFPVWLLGDSEPRNWSQVLEVPLDSRHPARHNIWTPVVDVIQDRVFREGRRRLDTTALYVRNAARDPNDRPDPSFEVWNERLRRSVSDFAALVQRWQPVLILSFGAFAFEFGRRALGEVPRRGHRYWTTGRLGTNFRDRLAADEINRPKLVPLLHVSIARRHFLTAHEQFCRSHHPGDPPNYFEYVGRELANALVKLPPSLPIWV